MGRTHTTLQAKEVTLLLSQMGRLFEGLGPKSGMICLMFYKDQSNGCEENELLGDKDGRGQMG